MPDDIVLEVNDIKNYLGNKWVHSGLNFKVKRGEIVAIIGPSGCGKTTLLRTILMLRPQTSGTVKVFGIDTIHASEKEMDAIRKHWGMMFQSAALFSSLTVEQNITFPIHEFAQLNQEMMHEMAMLKLSLVGLQTDDAVKYPAELSGGMKKRVAMARAIASDPELVFLDEPTSGLDPHSAEEIDSLVLYLRQHLGITFVLVTHDLDTLWRVPDKIAFIGEGKILAFEPINELVKNKNPIIQNYFSGVRAKRLEVEGGK